MVNLVESKLEEIKTLCLKHSVAELYLFGSAASGTFNHNSDIDFAVIFNSSLLPLEHGTAFFGLKDDLEALFNRSVDLVTYRSLKNPIFKQALDKSKVPLYAA